jgi:hypothetical protein
MASKTDNLTVICEPTMKKKCASFGVSQPYNPPRPVTGLIYVCLFFIYFNTSETISTKFGTIQMVFRDPRARMEVSPRELNLPLLIVFLSRGPSQRLIGKICVHLVDTVIFYNSTRVPVYSKLFSHYVPCRDVIGTRAVATVRKLLGYGDNPTNALHFRNLLISFFLCPRNDG